MVKWLGPKLHRYLKLSKELINKLFRKASAWSKAEKIIETT